MLAIGIQLSVELAATALALSSESHTCSAQRASLPGAEPDWACMRGRSACMEGARCSQELWGLACLVQATETHWDPLLATP